MVKQSRPRYESGVYHVVLRGVNRGDIFFDEQDHQRFLNTLAQKKDIKNMLYGYCR